MDLLNNQTIKKEEPKGKKMVKLLLILSIIAVIGVIILMVFVSMEDSKKTSLFINGEEKELKENLIVVDNNGVQYISLKEIAYAFDYEYYGGDYKSFGVDETKCYIKNGNLISGFEKNSETMYKYEEGTDLDYQYYALNNNIVMHEYELYVSLDDIRLTLNAECQITQKNQIIINSMEEMLKKHTKNLSSKDLIIDETQNNLKTLSYGLIVVKKDNQYSILNEKYEEITAAKYSSIYFDEYNLNFIVSNLNGRYGVISYSGVVEQRLNYDAMEIINYENMLYKIKFNEKYGIVNKEGELLTHVEYDEIGYPADEKNKIINTVLIEDIEGTLIVVKQNEFYGLVRLEDGEVYLPCDHLEKIYGINELGEIKYKVEVEGQTLYLEEYLGLRGII